MVEAMPIAAKAHGLRPQLHDEILKFGDGRERLDVIPPSPARPFGIA